MKSKFFRCLALLCAGLSVLLCAATSGFSDAAQEVRITFLHTCDLHGHIAPVWSEEHGELRGGLLRCATLVRELRRREEHTLLLDCGDIFQGAPESFLTKGSAVAEAVGMLGYDALVIGNHEFDWGLEALRLFYRQLDCPALAANLQAGGAGASALSCLRPFLVKEIAGLRVVVVGLSNPLIPKWSRPRLIEGCEFEDSLPALRRIMPAVRALKPDILALAVHQGLRYRADDAANQIRAIAAAFPEFDLILGAHTHRAVAQTHVNGILYSQAGSYGLWLGVARIVFDPAARRIVSRQAELLPVGPQVEPDRELRERLAGVLRQTDEYLRANIAATEVDLLPASRQPGQSAAQTLIARAIAGKTGADVVLHGALSRARVAPGRISMGDVWRMVPYENYVGVACLTLEELRAILEENSAYLRSADFRGVFGIVYDLDPQAPSGARVSNIRPAEAGRKPDGRRLAVAFNSYDMASAGGRFPVLREIIERPEARLREIPELDTRALVEDYLRANSPLQLEVAPGVRVLKDKKTKPSLGGKNL